MPEPTNYRHLAPLDYDRFAKRLKRIRQLVPIHYPECYLASVTLSFDDYDRLMIAWQEPLPKQTRRSFLINGIQIEARFDVAAGHLQLGIVRPTTTTVKTVALKC